MSLTAVFFDLDGTLLDTSYDLGFALNEVLKKHGIAPLQQIQIRPHVSNGAAALIKLGFGEDLESGRVTELRQQLLDCYETHIAQFTKPFPGIMELLEDLTKNGMSWGVVTNKPSLYTNKLMSKIQYPSAPSAIVSPDDVGIGKPDPKPLLEACQQAQCGVENAIYIGDHQRDIECGHNAGMKTIAVGYGFTSDPNEHRQWQATHCVDHAHQIWPILRAYIAH